MKKHLKILGVGHPRTGSKTLEMLLRSWGFTITHEGEGLDGVVSWQFATEADAPLIAYRRDEVSQKMDPKNYSFDFTIYHLRDPYFSLPSISITETFSDEFRSKWGGYNLTKNKLENSIRSILSWDKLILQKNPDVIFRVEYDIEKLYFHLRKKFGEKVYWSNDQIGKKHNKRVHGQLESLKEEIDGLSPELMTEMNDFCRKYFYKPIFDIENKSLIPRPILNTSLRIVPNSEKYYEFIRELRTHPENLSGFVDTNEITPQQQYEYMSKYGHNYEICLSGDTPVGFVGVVDRDIRFAVDPKHHGQGIGKFMIWDLIHKNSDCLAKVKHDNIASIKVFESCDFKLYNKDDDFLYYCL